MHPTSIPRIHIWDEYLEKFLMNMLSPVHNPMAHPPASITGSRTRTAQPLLVKMSAARVYGDAVALGLTMTRQRYNFQTAHEQLGQSARQSENRHRPMLGRGGVV